MTLDIRGSKKNTRINSDVYVAIQELFSNAIDSYLIRKTRDSSAPDFTAKLDVELADPDLAGNYQSFIIRCEDNGAGFGGDEVKAFATKDTSFKDDLAIPGIGQCKGSGRIQFLHYFSDIQISSIFREEDSFRERTLHIKGDTKEVSTDDFKLRSTDETDHRTRIILSSPNMELIDRILKGENLKKVFSPTALKNNALLFMMQRLVALANELGQFSIKFETSEPDGTRTAESLSNSDVPKPENTKMIKVHYENSNEGDTPKFETLKISHYLFNTSDLKLEKNLVTLCAKFSPVKNITRRYLKTGAIENRPLNGGLHLIMVEGEFLNKNVNEQRDDFNIPEKREPQETLFSNLSFEEIYEAIDEQITRYLAPPDWTRESIVADTNVRYGISNEMINHSNIKIHFGDTPESVATRVLGKFQEEIVENTSEIFDLKEELKNVQTDSDEFRDKVNNLAWQYTKSLKSMNMATLSQLVVRRSAIVEIFDMAVHQILSDQVPKPNKKRKDEKVIHNIFFPMGKDSTETTDHDIWLLGEEYGYYEYISSDKTLASIKLQGNEHFFEADIDDEILALLKKNITSNEMKRPDIALFNGEGAAVIVEFKAPGVSLDEYTQDLLEYANLLVAKSKGNLKQIYGYLIGTEANENRIGDPYKPFPSGKGWFGTQPLRAPKSHMPIGEMYSEIIYYKDLIERSRQRLQVYREKLDVEL